MESFVLFLEFSQATFNLFVPNVMPHFQNEKSFLGREKQENNKESGSFDLKIALKHSLSSFV